MIRVNDPLGVDPTIEELAPAFVPQASCDSYLPPPIPDFDVGHGTEVASIALGRADNGICAAGIAPEASLSACWGPKALDDSEVARFFLNGLNTTHISINSWGFDACRRIGADDDAIIIFEDDMFGDDTRGRHLQGADCPFVQNTFRNPCELPLCTDFGLEDSNCQDYIIDYCQTDYDEEVAACAEYLDRFISCEFNVRPMTETVAMYAFYIKCF